MELDVSVENVTAFVSWAGMGGHDGALPRYSTVRGSDYGVDSRTSGSAGARGLRGRRGRDCGKILKTGSATMRRASAAVEMVGGRILRGTKRRSWPCAA